MQTHKVKQINWLYRVIHVKWCPGEGLFLSVSTIPTLYLKPDIESHVLTHSSRTQRLEDYWLGLRLHNMDCPALELVKTDDVSHIRCILSKAG